MTDEKDGQRKSARGRRARKKAEDPAPEAEQETEGASQEEEEPAKEVETKGAETAETREVDAEPTEAAADAEESSEEEQEHVASAPSIPRLTAEEVIATGESWLATLFEKMRLDLKAEGSAQDDGYVFNVSGSDTGDLIGRSRKSPRVLLAIQTLLSEKIGPGAGGPIIVDLGGFKQERQVRLNEIAGKLARAASRVKRPMTIAGLSNYERKIIHQALADEDGVSTESVDHGIFRKLRLTPE